MTAPGWESRRTSFGSQADAYAAGRPSYPVDAIRWVLPAGASRVLDLAAGTGRLAERLLALELDVVAVEPLDEMRAHVPSAADAMPGTAEAIPLPDASVDAVFVGQAFHWFDAARAAAEIRRVLRPGGRVGIFWNLLDDRDPLAASVADLLTAEERFSNLQDAQPPPYADVDGMAPPTRRFFDHEETYDADRLAAFVLSRSQTILMPPEERHDLLEQVRELAPKGEFPLRLVCEGWRGDRA
jgi:SAM-dependent methyltransferase